MTACHMTQVVRGLLVGVVVAGWACSSRSNSQFIIPADPEATVASFMGAVAANNVTAMGQLWGTRDGPALGRMEDRELSQRLAVMRRYLVHDEYRILRPELSTTNTDRLQAYEVEISRGSCVHRVPFTLVRVGSGWLVSQVDLTQAGNPARPCGGTRR